MGQQNTLLEDFQLKSSEVFFNKKKTNERKIRNTSGQLVKRKGNVSFIQKGKKKSKNVI